MPASTCMEASSPTRRRTRFKRLASMPGSDPDEDGNPVGLVCIAVARGFGPLPVERKYGEIGRENVQEHAMADALAELIRCLEAD